MNASDTSTTGQPAPAPILSRELLDISERLKTQDNYITQNPMFCVQEKVRDYGYDTTWVGQTVWMEDGDEVPEGTHGAEETGYKDRWVTVMVAFTEGGCKQYLDLNGHNHRGETRIYVESFNRCPEMIAIREALMSNADLSDRAVYD